MISFHHLSMAWPKVSVRSRVNFVSFGQIDSLTVRVSTASRATAQAFGTVAEIAAAEQAVSSAYIRPRSTRKQSSALSSSNSSGSTVGESSEAAPHPTEPLILDDRVVRLVNTPLRYIVVVSSLQRFRLVMVANIFIKASFHFEIFYDLQESCISSLAFMAPE